MKNIFGAAASLALLALTVSAATAASDTSSSMPTGAVGKTFAFTTSVRTPKGNKSASGTIVLKQTGPQNISLTVYSSDGSSRTIPLVIANGTVAPDPAHTAAPSDNSESQAAAQAMIANMKLAAEIGMAARKSDGKSFSVAVQLTPVGQGTAMPAQLSMTASGGGGQARYAGSVEAQTTTQLPPSSGIDPAQLEKAAGVAVVAHGMTPAGRVAVHVLAHRRAKEQKEAASGDLPDSIKLSVTSHFAGGRFHDIAGTQTDALTIAGKTTTIVSNWSFTAAP